MKILKRSLGKATHLLFMDIEGTQLAHEVIEIGAVLAPVDAKKSLIPGADQTIFRCFCRPHEPVGRIVTALTGITDAKVEEEGIDFETAMRRLNRLVGNFGDNLAVVVFGNQDSLMLSSSLSHEPDNQFLNSFVAYLQKHIFDYAEFISTYVRDQKGQPLSLLHLLESFSVLPCGQAHDPVNDALNLLNLYDKINKSPGMLAARYRQTLLGQSAQQRSQGLLVADYIAKLLRGEDIAAADYAAELEKLFE